MFDSTAVNCRIIPGTAVGPLGIGLREVPGTDFGEVKRLGAGILKSIAYPCRLTSLGPHSRFGSKYLNLELVVCFCTAMQ